MAEMLEQLQLAIGTLRQDRSTEGLHNFLDSHGLAGQLVSRGAREGRVQVSGDYGFARR